MQLDEKSISLVPIREKFISDRGIKLFILREDLIHPFISGNKWRKLKYNILEAQKNGYQRLLTFGGAYSNHIAATACFGESAGMETIGIIRGEEKTPPNTTLMQAGKNGMRFKYISREKYREKGNAKFLKELRKEFGDFYMLPEGGTNMLAIKGCTEIVDNVTIPFDIICCPCGTGGTLSGLIASLSSSKAILGFSALKGGSFLEKDVKRLLLDYSTFNNDEIGEVDWKIIHDYHFGGYAKITAELIDFIKEFNRRHQVMLDLVYTSKMLYGLYDKIKSSNRFDGKTIVAIHTGGVQGNLGFQERYGVILE